MAKYRAGRVRQEILREVNNILLLEIKEILVIKIISIRYI